MTTTVVNRRNYHYDVYIGRRSSWGNPFSIGKDGTREEVIEKYREYISKQPRLLNRIGELRGKVLGCWCAPLPCHGTVLLELIQEKFGGKMITPFLLVEENDG